MGADVYWKPTPKPQEEQLICLGMPTWGLLSDLWEIESRDDFDEMVLGKERLNELKAVALTAKQTNNNEIYHDIQGLINGINKHDSVTLNVRS